jgi:hypothetical protein
MAGKWINRDLIQEKGGLNLYGFTKNNGVSGIDILGLAWNWDNINIGEFSVSYDPSMIRRSHGSPTQHLPGGAVAQALADSLGGLNSTLFRHYLSGSGATVDLTGEVKIKSEVGRSLEISMQAEMTAMVKKVESFVCPQKGILGFNLNVLGDRSYSPLKFVGFTSEVWVIRKAQSGFSSMVDSTVICQCNAKSGKYEPVASSVAGRFKLYFYDQFADAADIPHKIAGAQEFNGSAQFDEIGAWGKTMIQTGKNQ